MTNPEVPYFIQQGGFNWSSKGYFYSPTEEERICIKERYDENEWYDIANIVERAKAGDFSRSGDLSNYFVTDLATNAAPIALLVTGDIGSRSDLQKLSEVMRAGPDGFRVYAALAAANSGCLWLVPHMLEAWLLCKGLDAHESIGYAIANLLDPMDSLDDLGPIGTNAGNFDIGIGTYPSKNRLKQLAVGVSKHKLRPSFSELVEQSYSNFCNKFGHEDALIWGGQEISVYTFAERFLELITSDQFSIEQAPLVIALRQKFEASTGLNCSDFFRRHKFSQISAVGVLEEFLDNQNSALYKESHRYFFGHLIP